MPLERYNNAPLNYFLIMIPRNEMTRLEDMNICGKWLPDCSSEWFTNFLSTLQCVNVLAFPPCHQFWRLSLFIFTNLRDKNFFFVLICLSLRLNTESSHYFCFWVFSSCLYTPHASVSSCCHLLLCRCYVSRGKWHAWSRGRLVWCLLVSVCERVCTRTCTCVCVQEVVEWWWEGGDLCI